ncbi:MAG: class III signal peptide-containing protein [Elusimicrobia bacterium]|nr:class III signal peptide-containing protein [Elusimicrobiota bacterium]
MKRPRARGQASVEYMLLLSTVLVMALMTGAFISKFGRDLLDDIAMKVLEAAITLAMP